MLLIDIEEYKLLNGWSYDKKRGSVRYDRIPVGIRKVSRTGLPAGLYAVCTRRA